MQMATILRVLGMLLMIFSISMLPPIAVSEYFQNDITLPFVIAFFLTLATGFILWTIYYNARKELKIRDGFLVVVLFWVVLSVFAALPFMIAGLAHGNWTDAIFESVSGFTTTGATVLSGLDLMPEALLYYRQQLHFLGGMGIIVLAVAILPMLGIGGMQLYRAETPGPLKDTKLTPRITQTAKALWCIYFSLTILCGISYWLAGMTPFDAIGEAFSTVATGGFSMHDASFGYYNSSRIEMIGVTFMILSAINFSLHFTAWHRKSIRHYWQDQEFRVFILLIIAAVGITFTTLMWHETYVAADTTFYKSLFNVVALMTTTGLVSSHFANWPTFLPLFVMLLAIIGSCAGSTCGGMKLIRVSLLYKQGMRELYRLIHPNAVRPIKFGERTLPEHILQAMWGFSGAFLGMFLLLTLILMANGLDFNTAFGAVVATLANAGQGIGDVAGGFADLSDTCKWVLVFAMFAGRLEIFTLMVLFTPEFWRR